MKTLHGQFAWYELIEKDATAACEFYGAVLGWNQIEPLTPQRPYPGLAIGDVPVANVVPVCGEMADSVPATWVGFVEVEDLAEAGRRLEALGGRRLTEVEDVSGFGAYATYADPQGAVLNFIERPTHRSQEGVAANTQGLVCWRELRTPNALAALESYGSLFGWTQVASQDMGRLGTYHMIGTGSGQPAFGAIFNLDVEGIPPHWFYYFFVDELDAAIERATSRGAKLYRDPEEIPGPSWMAPIIDPQGAGFALIAMKR